MRHKTVYFAQRNPNLKERFRPRWRRHAALGMSLPIWDRLRRYAHYDPVVDPPAELGVTARYDGIGIGWIKTAEGYEANAKADAMQAMRRDELETFGVPVITIAFLCVEDVLKDDGQGQFKIFSVVNRGDDPKTDDLGAAIRNGFAADLLAHPELGPRLARLAVCTPSELADIMRPGRTHDALIELSFHTLEDAASVFASDAYAAISLAHRGVIVEVERCATRELVLDDIALYD